jgi:DNA repair protein RadD
MPAPVLRDYQLRAIGETLAHIQQGKRAPLIVSPTGSGKTVLGAAIVARHIAKGGKGVVWVAHRSELVEQAYDTISSFGVTCGAIGETVNRPARAFARVQVAMIQTLVARGLRPEASLFVYDEAHHAPADGGVKVLNDYAHAYRAGLTATPERADGKALDEVFDCIVEAVSIKDLTARGVLVPCEVIAPNRHLGVSKIAQAPVEAWLEHGRGRPTILFAPNMDAAKEYVESFVTAGISCELVTGEMDSGKRAATINKFKDGKLQVLACLNVLTEGFDHPPTSCAIIARACGSAGLFLQIVGRILRCSPGKKDAVLIDLPGVTHLHGKPDEDRIYSLDGKGIQRASDVSGVRLCAVCSSPMEPGTGCPQCAYEGPGVKVPSVTGDTLEKFAGKRRESDDERATTLARWLLAGQEKKHKPGAALHRFSAVYGGWPPPSVTRAAWDLVKAWTEAKEAS